MFMQMTRIIKKTMLIIYMFAILLCSVGCSGTEEKDEPIALAQNKSEDIDYTGIWLTVPLGQVGYTLNAEAIWIKNIENNMVEYETAYLSGRTDSVYTSGADYEWSLERHTDGIADITVTDITGINGFFADKETIYMDKNELVFGIYDSADMRMVKTKFQSFDECIDYYNIDYGKNFSKNNVILKHGINDDYKSDNYWYYYYQNFLSPDSQRKVSVSLTLWDEYNDDERSLFIVLWNERMQRCITLLTRLNYNEVGEDGAYIYYPYHTIPSEIVAATDTESFEYILKYYPTDHHIEVESADQYAAGVYDCADEIVEYDDVQEDSISESYETDNETLTNNIDDTSISEEDNLWFLNYDSFYHVRAGDELSVCAMNDALLLVSFYGINGDSMDWELDMEPNEIGSDGELIYYYGKDFRLNYYPSDHHIYIETSNDIYSGEYWPNE